MLIAFLMLGVKISSLIKPLIMYARFKGKIIKNTLCWCWFCCCWSLFVSWSWCGDWCWYCWDWCQVFHWCYFLKKQKSWISKKFVKFKNNNTYYKSNDNKINFSKIYEILNLNTVKPVYSNHHRSGPKQSGRYWQVVVVEVIYVRKGTNGTTKWWLLNTGGHYLEVVICSGLTVIIIYYDDDNFAPFNF